MLVLVGSGEGGRGKGGLIHNLLPFFCRTPKYILKVKVKVLTYLNVKMLCKCSTYCLCNMEILNVVLNVIENVFTFTFVVTLAHLAPTIECTSYI